MRKHTITIRNMFLAVLALVLLSFTAQTNAFAGNETASPVSLNLPVGGWSPPEMCKLDKDIDVINASEKATRKKSILNAKSGSVFTQGASTFGYDALSSDAQKQYYARIDQEATAFMNAASDLEPMTVDGQAAYIVAGLKFTDFGLNSEEAWQAYMAYDYDHPAYYWISNRVGYSNDSIFLYTNEEYASVSTRNEINALVTSGVQEYAALAAYGEDTLDEIALVHDKIVSTIDYAENNGSPETARWAHSVQGVFDPAHHKAVCEGYSEAFSLIMNYLEIPNCMITGEAGEDDDRGGHAWNAVSDDGGTTYMYMDLTWDDYDASTGYDYYYFGMPKTDFEACHFANTSSNTEINWLYDLPDAISDDFSGTYYCKGGHYYDGTGSASDFAHTIRTKAARAGNCVAYLCPDSTTRSSVHSVLGGRVGYNDKGYKGTTYSNALKLLSSSEEDLSGATVTVVSEAAYTGEAVEPEVEVTLYGITLVKDQNYTVSYENNTDVGEATVTVTGTGVFTGSASATFTIAAANPEDNVSVLAFTSDVHNSDRKVPGWAAFSANTRLGTWINQMIQDQGKIDIMAFGGDMADSNSSYIISPNTYWTMTQDAMDTVANSGIKGVKDVNGVYTKGIYTTGNHEYSPGGYSATSTNATQQAFRIDTAAVEGSNYHMYCLGSTSKDQTYTCDSSDPNSLNKQEGKLRAYLNGITDDKPIFIVSHYPLHYVAKGVLDNAKERKTTNAEHIISALNDAADSGKTIVFLWGHNHTNAQEGEDNYDQIFAPNSTFQYGSKATSVATFKFYYASAGCMSDKEFGTYSPGSGCIEGKGLIVKVDGNNNDALTFAYYDEEGNDVTGHVKESYAAVKATCTESGLTAGKKCITCDKVLVEQQTIAPTGHKWGTPSYVWSEDNQTVTATRICQNNKSHVETETVNATAETTQQATCTEDGETTYTASFENSAFSTQTKTESIEQLGHTWGTPSYAWSEDNSTCTATRVCTRDGSHAEFQEVSTSSTVTTPATCEQAGVRTYTADFTNEAFADQTTTAVIPATGHSWSAWTKLDDDQHQKVCANNQEHVEKQAHSWNAGIVTTEPTCTTTGVKTYTCEVCGGTKTEVIAATGHSWGAWTKLDDNQHQKVCANDPQHVEKQAHSWNDGVVTTEPTCTTTGVKTYTCAVCNGTKTEIVDALGHDWGAWTSIDANQHQRVCTHNSQHTETKDHTWNDGEVLTAPTCTEKGEKEYTCTACNETKTEETAALGHDWGEATYKWSADNSQCTATRTCKREKCSETETETAATTKATTPASYIAKGKTVYTTAAFANEAFKVQTKTVDIPQLAKKNQTVIASGKTAKVKYSKVKKKKQTIARSKVVTVSAAQGTVTYAKLSGNKKITINATTGKVTVKKKLKKGKYKVKIRVYAAGTYMYNPGYKDVTAVIRVK